MAFITGSRVDSGEDITINTDHIISAYPNAYGGTVITLPDESISVSAEYSYISKLLVMIGEKRCCSDDG